jgi:hypothetical protein
VGQQGLAVRAPPGAVAAEHPGEPLRVLLLQLPVLAQLPGQPVGQGARPPRLRTEWIDGVRATRARFRRQGCRRSDPSRSPRSTGRRDPDPRATARRVRQGRRSGATRQASATTDDGLVPDGGPPMLRMTLPARKDARAWGRPGRAHGLRRAATDAPPWPPQRRHGLTRPSCGRIGRQSNVGSGRPVGFHIGSPWWASGRPSCPPGIRWSRRWPSSWGQTGAGKGALLSLGSYCSLAGSVLSASDSAFAL